jgi:hypothetical protein
MLGLAHNGPLLILRRSTSIVDRGVGSQIVTEVSTRTVVAIRLILNSLVSSLNSTEASIDGPGGWCVHCRRGKETGVADEYRGRAEELKSSGRPTV